jgi:hypothetical protein
METFTYDNNEDIRKFVDKYKLDVNDFKNIYVNCRYYETRNSWGHKGELRSNTLGNEITYKIRYYNRTWESYTYRTLLMSLLDRYATALTGIDYGSVSLFDEQEMNDFKTMSLKEFQEHHPYYKGKTLRETKKHYRRIGEL